MPVLHGARTSRPELVELCRYALCFLVVDRYHIALLSCFPYAFHFYAPCPKQNPKHHLIHMIMPHATHRVYHHQSGAATDNNDRQIMDSKICILGGLPYRK